MNILDELQWRGLIADCTDTAELTKRLSAGPIRLYCGFDPTADSLHVGNLVPLLALRRFQLFGHHPIVLAGGAGSSFLDMPSRTSTCNAIDPTMQSSKDRCCAAGRDITALMVEMDIAKWTGQKTIHADRTMEGRQPTPRQHDFTRPAGTQ